MLDLAGNGWCAGALLASDVVLTARSCVSVLTGGSLACPAAAPQISGGVDLTNVHVYVGDDIATAEERAQGRAVLVPEGDVLCGADIALLLLDATIDDVAPLVVQPTGAPVGAHVRSVGCESGRKLVRDHVAVVAASSLELELAEAPCDTTPGAPAIDETSAQIVGIVSRSGPTCAAADGVRRRHPHRRLHDPRRGGARRGPVEPRHRPGQGEEGPRRHGCQLHPRDRCAAGVCVTYAGAEYCTRTCDPTDHCPTDYKCMGIKSGSTVCVQE